MQYTENKQKPTNLISVYVFVRMCVPVHAENPLFKCGYYVRVRGIIAFDFLKVFFLLLFSPLDNLLFVSVALMFV